MNSAKLWPGLLASLLIGCQHPNSPSSRWKQIDSFACQLQNLNLEQAVESPFKLLITDPTRDGNTAYSRAEVARLKQGGRLLLGYLSVGEAENYRPYWQKGWKPGKPGWLGPTNPEWGGNYKVRYWHTDWHKIVLRNAAEIQALGFDGLFLDVVDAWEYWQPHEAQAAAAMRALIQKIAGQTRLSQPDFGIVLNGGEGLLDDSQLLHAITGVAKEEIYFGLNGDGKVTPREFTRVSEKKLAPVVRAGKLVLSIDYTRDPAQKKLARQQAHAQGYLEFIGTRGLDSIPPQ